MTSSCQCPCCSPAVSGDLDNRARLSQIPVPPEVTSEGFGEEVRFARMRLNLSSVQAFSTKLTVALMHLWPITGGHTILIPRRQVERLADLTEEELADFSATIRTAQCVLRRKFLATDFNIAILDGIGVGQPLPHLHAHVVPRLPGDDLGNDQVHEAINDWAPEPRIPNEIRFLAPDDESRKPRDLDTMALEASRYRPVGKEAVEGSYTFGKFGIPAATVFYHSPSGLTVAFVNLKPLVPGHVLVTPRRLVPYLADLTEEEMTDLFRSVREVQAIVCEEYGADAANIGIQDGKESGQSVPHVHVHILPGGLPDEPL